MTGYGAGDARERNSLCVAIDRAIGAAEVARELGDYQRAGALIRDAFELHKALRKLERAVCFVASIRAGVNAVGGAT